MAVKVISREAKKDESQKAYLIGEQRMLKRFSKEREGSLSGSDEGGAGINWMIWLEASWADTLNYYLLTPAFPVTIEDMLEQGGRFPPAITRFYAIELIIAVDTLHAKGIVHRDIKGANVFISDSGHVVLGDFGFSKDFGQAPTPPEIIYQPYWPYGRDQVMVDSSTPRRHPETLVFATRTPVGSYFESPPEIWEQVWYSFGVDWWALAVTVFRLL
ncbi:kinase-like protein, partial [Pluteus cervinus]